MKKITWFFLIVLTCFYPMQVIAGMKDVERVGTNMTPWIDSACSISIDYNVECSFYRDFVGSLGKTISNATNSELATALGITNGVSVDLDTAKQIKRIMNVVESKCLNAEQNVQRLPANDLKRMCGK